MKKNNIEKKSTWRNWLIKKLLIKETSKEDLISFITKSEDNYTELSNQEFEDNDENNLIKNIFSLNEKNVEDIMVPRGEIIAIEKNKNIQEILSVIENESHSRMPVYNSNLDNTLGFFHIKDLINNIENQNFDLSKILREILYVAPKSPILQLLKRMRSSRIHMGLIVDEFGGVDGLVTIEDLVEEIVGDIEDEHDAESNEIKLIKIDNKKIIVNSSFKITEVEKIFNIKIKTGLNEEIETVGGLVFFIANRVPKIKEVFKIDNNLELKIIDADNRKIITVEIKINK